MKKRRASTAGEKMMTKPQKSIRPTIGEGCKVIPGLRFQPADQTMQDTTDWSQWCLSPSFHCY